VVTPIVQLKIGTPKTTTKAPSKKLAENTNLKGVK
jgi:hypothetical protein